MVSMTNAMHWKERQCKALHCVTWLYIEMFCFAFVYFGLLMVTHL